jgi:hypothetical protein
MTVGKFTGPRWYEDMPYGPLTRQNHDLLSLLSYDLPRSETTSVAQARGVARGDYLRVRFAEMAVQTEAALATLPVTEDQELNL